MLGNSEWFVAGMILSVLFVSVAVGRHGFYDELRGLALKKDTCHFTFHAALHTKINFSKYVNK